MLNKERKRKIRLKETDIGQTRQKKEAAAQKNLNMMLMLKITLSLMRISRALISISGRFRGEWQYLPHEDSVWAGVGQCAHNAILSPITSSIQGIWWLNLDMNMMDGINSILVMLTHPYILYLMASFFPPFLALWWSSNMHVVPPFLNLKKSTLRRLYSSYMDPYMHGKREFHMQLLEEYEGVQFNCWK
ncbi:conserved hypothetical protein [Ricinus communis]|uniref:Uncharacterized protein n=1 Tax=Ricinus communis TaxID=3988 RepID=B9SCF4_RICCO|nr:conserved hypothetical protein [Ricinus communis]